MCDDGRVACIKVGAHRRVRRGDVERLLRPELTRDQLKALWLHRAVAGKVVADPAVVLAKAAVNLDRLQRIHPEGMATVWLERWRSTLRAGVEAVLEVLTSRSEYAVELRQNSPFAGVLSEAERQAVLAAFGDYWRSERAA
jgi:hypothetical protein